VDRVLRRSLVVAALAHGALALVASRAKEPEPPRTSEHEIANDAPTTETFVMLDEDFEQWLVEPSAAPSGGPTPTAPDTTPTAPPPPIPSPTSKSLPTATPTEMLGIVETPAMEAIPVPSIEAPATKGTATIDPLAKFDPSGKKWVAPLGAGAKLDDPKTIETKTKEEKLAAKVSKDVTALVDGKPSTGSLYAGPVVSAAHDAATSPIAPDVGIAVFVVRTDAAGTVTSVSVRDVNGDFPGWAAVGKKLETALVAKKLVVPSGASGVQVTVKVSAKYALPSGANPKKPIDADVGGTPFGPGIAGTFDLADIGSKPMRVVAVVVLDEGRL
jgi:hypothetical protein